MFNFAVWFFVIHQNQFIILRVPTTQEIFKGATTCNPLIMLCWTLEKSRSILAIAHPLFHPNLPLPTIYLAAYMCMKKRRHCFLSFFYPTELHFSCLLGIPFPAYLFLWWIIQWTEILCCVYLVQWCCDVRSTITTCMNEVTMATQATWWHHLLYLPT